MHDIGESHATESLNDIAELMNLNNRMKWLHLSPSLRVYGLVGLGRNRQPDEIPSMGAKWISDSPRLRLHARFPSRKDKVAPTNSRVYRQPMKVGGYGVILAPRSRSYVNL